MTEDEVVRLLRDYFVSLFPLDCACCGRQYQTIQDYIALTTRIGPVTSYDAALGDWRPAAPIGTLAQSNCACGSTFALGTEGMPLPQRLALLDWIRRETQTRGAQPSEILEELRDRIQAELLDLPAPPSAEDPAAARRIR